MKLKEKVVVITGAASGLGKALATVCVQEGMHVVMGDLPNTGLEDEAKEVGGLAVVANMTKRLEVQALAKTAMEKFGSIDVWINNAGIWIPHAPLLEQTSEHLHALMEVNFFGTLYGSQAAFAQMQRQKAGTIVNILSIRVKEPKVNTAGYAASKAAATAMTNTLRLEAEEFDIHVIGVFPSRIKTNLFRNHAENNFDGHMDPLQVAQLIVINIKKSHPKKELVIDGINTEKI